MLQAARVTARVFHRGSSHQKLTNSSVPLRNQPLLLFRIRNPEVFDRVLGRGFLIGRTHVAQELAALPDQSDCPLKSTPTSPVTVKVFLFITGNQVS
jgi:hypothetical protein